MNYDERLYYDSLQCFLSPWPINELYHELGYLRAVSRGSLGWCPGSELLCHIFVYNDPDHHMVLTKGYYMTVLKYEPVLHFNKGARALSKVLQKVATRLSRVLNWEVPRAESLPCREYNIVKLCLINLGCRNLCWLIRSKVGAKVHLVYLFGSIASISSSCRWVLIYLS